MNDLEQLVRTTLNTFAERAPEPPEFNRYRHHASRLSLIAPAAGALVAAVLVLTFVWVDSRATTQDSPPATDYDGVANLTGPDVGYALGLKPTRAGVPSGCHFAVASAGQLWCLDTITRDPVEQQILQMQIWGYQRNDTLTEYVTAFRDMVQQTKEPHEDWAPVWALRDNVINLKEQLVQVQDDDPANMDLVGLSGKDVGIALDLEPTTTNVVIGCGHGTEYPSQGPGEFCLDGVTHDPVDERVLIEQIRGWQRDQYLVDYSKGWIELEATFLAAGRNDQWIDDLRAAQERLAVIQSQMTKIKD